MEKKIKFIYIVKPVCSSDSPYITENPDVAERASKNGCRVTCNGRLVEWL